MNRTLTVTLIWFCQQVTAQDSRLIAFVNKDASIDQNFLSNDWPRIKELSTTYGIETTVINQENGTPEEISITPQLVFENANGRSIYVGRYSEIDRLKVFLRSVKNNPKQQKENMKYGILSFKDARSATVLPLKLTDLTGTIPKDFVPERFHSLCIEAFTNSFASFNIENVNFTNSDRAFYIDLHPYISEDGILYASYEVYSQFNCVIPVLSVLNKPKSSNLADAEKLFSELAVEIENWILNYSRTATNGDAFTPVDAPITSWEDLGFSSDYNSQKKSTQWSAEISNNWDSPSSIDPFTPLIQFNFFTTLDIYAGEATELTGQLSWNKSKLSGRFQVLAESITMGEETYDQNVHKKYLKVKKYPKAIISFQDQQVDRAMIISDPGTTFIINGTLEFMGKTNPIIMLSQFEPFIDADGKERLIVTARFEVNIFQNYNIKGPDGPKEAKESMAFMAQSFSKQTQNNYDNSTQTSAISPHLNWSFFRLGF